VDFYRSCVRPILFRFDPEWIHTRTLRAARAVAAFRPARKALEHLYGFDDPRLRVELAGLDFPNPVGMPGGFDKNGLGVEAISTAGFGFQDVGSVSLHASPGNPERPRLFRLPLDESIGIYYGVPNDGAEVVARRLTRAKVRGPLGINLVETNTGRMACADEVIDEIVRAYRPFQGLADYIVINMNCPNSAGGMSVLDEPQNLRRLLEGFRGYAGLPPMFLKITMPLDPERVDAVLGVTDAFRFVKGFAPSGLKPPTAALRTPREQLARVRGGITGPYTREAADETIRFWYSRVDPSRYALISAGGIFSAEDAYRRIRLGASLVQVYTAVIYRGPGLVKDIKRGLCALLERDGLTNVRDAVGLDAVPPAPRSARPAQAAGRA
jgi:dihydroorotate dehydrogenase (fumarate)/dihydroorotate dehydrogenase